MQRVLIVGAGGHGQVVADILMRAEEAGEQVQALGYLDDAPASVGRTFLGLPVLGALADLPHVAHDALIIAIGSNHTRRRLFNRLQEQGERFVTARHPRAVIAPDVRIGQGVMICAGVVVNPGSTIGDHVILNTGCTVDHHNQLAAYVHIAPGAHLGGDVTIGEGVLVGIGATVMPQRTVGDWSIVGAGALVHTDLPGQVVATGVPARILKRTGE